MLEKNTESLEKSRQENDEWKNALMDESRRVAAESESVNLRSKEATEREHTLQQLTEALDEKEEDLKTRELNFREQSFGFDDRQKFLDDLETDLGARQESFQKRVREADKDISQAREQIESEKILLEAERVELETEKANLQKRSQNFELDFETRETKNRELEASLTAREELLQTFGDMFKDKIHIVMDKARPTEEISAEIDGIRTTSCQIRDAEVEVEMAPARTGPVKTPRRSSVRSTAAKQKRTQSTRRLTMGTRGAERTFEEDQEEEGTPKKRRSVVSRRETDWGWNDRLRDPSPRDGRQDHGSLASP